MRFGTFGFVFKQNKVVFNMKLECTNTELATYLI